MSTPYPLIPDDIFTEDLPDEVLNDEKLLDERRLWESSLKTLTMFIPFRESDKPNTFCVLLKAEGSTSQNSYHCHRYIRKMDGDWEVSVDGQNVSEEEALQWIPSPRAI